jgi:hypothetical protein
MTSVQTTSTPAASMAAHPRYKVTFPRVLRSEWSKFLSLRSSWITLAVAVLATVVIGMVAAYRYDPVHADQHDAVALSLDGITLAQLVVGVLGVLATAGEYTTGMIRSTFAAVPRRLPVLWSKCLIYFGVVFVVGAAGAVASFLAGAGFLSGKPIALTLSDTGVLRCLFGAALYLALVAVLGAGLGMLVRSAAGGICLLVGALMLMPVLLDLLPSNWKTDVTPYLPANAGQSIFTLHTDSTMLSPGTGLWVLLGWVTAVLVGAAYRVKHSDS